MASCLLPFQGCAARAAAEPARRSTRLRAGPAVLGRSAESRDSNPLYAEFAAALDKYDFRFRLGEKVTGTVLLVLNKGIYVDIGAKSAAFCPIAECGMGKASELCAVGDRVEFVIVKEESETKDQIVLLSLRRIELEAAWARVKAAQAKDEALECECFGVNRGGLLVTVEGIKAFVPTSQMSLKDKEDLDAMVGKKLSAKVMEADPEAGRLLMSARRAAESAKQAYAIGDVLLGTVQNVQPYGAFVEVAGGGSGLLHISQVSQDRLLDLSKVLASGDKIKVMVLSQEKGKLSFTTKKLEPSPGDMLRNPKRVFDRAEEMAAQFKARIAVAEKEAEASKAAPVVVKAAPVVGKGAPKEG